MSVRSLPADLQQKAQLELNEDPKRLNEDLQHLKDWISKQPHLRARTDDQWLVAFLRGCKFSLERTKEKLDLYYTCRTTIPEFWNIKHTDPRFNELLELGNFLLLPNTKGSDVPLVIIIRPGTYDADKYHISEMLAVSNILQKIVLMEFDNAVISGTRSILDLEGVTMGHFLQMTPSVMKKMVVVSQDRNVMKIGSCMSSDDNTIIWYCRTDLMMEPEDRHSNFMIEHRIIAVFGFVRKDAIPFRLKGSHFLNTPPGFETVFNAIRSLLNEKNKSRLYVHNKDYEDMYKQIPKEILPAEYGGNGGTVKEIIEYWKKKVQEYSSWLEEDEKYGTDEAKRPGKPKTSEEMFGVEGSFRQLHLD